MKLSSLKGKLTWSRIGNYWIWIVNVLLCVLFVSFIAKLDTLGVNLGMKHSHNHDFNAAHNRQNPNQTLHSLCPVRHRWGSTALLMFVWTYHESTNWTWKWSNCGQVSSAFRDTGRWPIPEKGNPNVPMWSSVLWSRPNSIDDSVGK